MKNKYFIVSLILCLIVFVFGGCKNNTETETTTEITTGLTAVVTTEETTEKKEAETTTEETTEKRITETEPEKESEETKIQTTENVEVGTTKYVVPVTTTKRPVETQVMREPTTKVPETTKKPATTKAEYYPSLTQADMEELKRYAINYIESKGYRADPDIKWDNAGYYVTCGIRDDLSSYGDKYKVNGGMSPLDFAKRDMKDAIDWHIKDFERANGPDSIYGMYPLVRRDSYGWEWTIGYW